MARSQTLTPEQRRARSAAAAYVSHLGGDGTAVLLSEAGEVARGDVDLDESGRFRGPSMPMLHPVLGTPQPWKDELARHFRAMGLSEAGAEAAAHGRD